jgi:hypothetical protein
MTHCTNCDNIILEDYCPKCGNAAKLKIIDKHYLRHEFMHLFHLEKGFIYTVKKLLTQPGESIREFLKENRNKLMKPVPFLVFTSLIYTIIVSFFPVVVANKIGGGSADSYIDRIFSWFQAHYAYANIATGFFIAFCTRLFYRKYNYNYFEIMTMLCYVLGINMLAMTILAVFYGTLNVIVYRILFTVFVYGYAVWAIGQFFNKGSIKSYLAAAASFIMGYLLYFTTISLIGIALDEILK